MMLRNNLQWLVITTILVVGNVSRAHDGPDHGPDDPSVRVWTFADTGAHVHGAYVASHDGKTQVRRTDGTMVSLEIEKLTILDQRWIERKAAQVKELNESATPTNGIMKLVTANLPGKPAIA